MRRPADRPAPGTTTAAPTTWPFRRVDAAVVHGRLIERRGEDIDTSFSRLARNASGLASGGLAHPLGQLAEALRDDRWDDDVTALAIRPTPRR
jgi:hypothetical protein